MKDRQSLNPNRITFTDEETNVTYTGTWAYADNPTVDGTLMNKAAFLTDATATALSLAQSDPTVNDAFAALAAHKSRHATGGADALTPADIGAAPLSALSSYVPTNQKGETGDPYVATMDSNKKIRPSQASSAYTSITANATIGSAHEGKTLLVGANATLTVATGNLTDGAEIEIWNTGSYTVTISGTGVLFVSGEGAQDSCTVDENSVAVIKRMGSLVYVAGGVSV